MTKKEKGTLLNNLRKHWEQALKAKINEDVSQPAINMLVDYAQGYRKACIDALSVGYGSQKRAIHMVSVIIEQVEQDLGASL